MLIEAILYKYKDDPIRKNVVVRGPNWYDVEIVKDDGNGYAIPHETQLSKEEVETAIVEYKEALRLNPQLNDPPTETE
tara:strand:- start:28 stop:261 length:234 start_codon:yes stop_codon:yes gene_type:complete